MAAWHRPQIPSFHRSGVPWLRALYVDWPTEAAAYDRGTRAQFLFGGRRLAAAPSPFFAIATPRAPPPPPASPRRAAAAQATRY